MHWKKIHLLRKDAFIFGKTSCRIELNRRFSRRTLVLPLWLVNRNVDIHRPSRVTSECYGRGILSIADVSESKIKTSATTVTNVLQKSQISSANMSILKSHLSLTNVEIKIFDWEMIVDDALKEDGATEVWELPWKSLPAYPSPVLHKCGNKKRDTTLHGTNKS